MSIDIQNVTKCYGDQKALNKISFKLKKGEIVAILGPNGAGKSTIMKIISCYLEEDEGNISICGIKKEGENLEVKKKVGYLPENNPLYLNMYIQEYLSFISKVYAIKNRQKKIEEIINETGLKLERGKKISSLSKGYRQRVGLAAALIHDPEILILDEPTTGLDPNQLTDMRNLIKRLGKNKTVLISTHIMQEVEKICDRAIIIKKGVIVEDKDIAILKNQNIDLEKRFQQLTS